MSQQGSLEWPGCMRYGWRGWGRVLKGIYPSDHTGARDQLHKGGLCNIFFHSFKPVEHDMSVGRDKQILAVEIHPCSDSLSFTRKYHAHSHMNCTNFALSLIHQYLSFSLTNINFAFTCTLMPLSLSLAKGPDHKIDTRFLRLPQQMLCNSSTFWARTNITFCLLLNQTKTLPVPLLH